MSKILFGVIIIKRQKIISIFLAIGLTFGINCLNINAEDFEPIPDENYEEPYEEEPYVEPDYVEPYIEPDYVEPYIEPDYIEPITTTPPIVPEETTITSETLQDATFMYQVENNEATLISCRTTELQYIKIPESIDGFPVTKISDTTFDECYNVAEIVIPYCVKSIDEGTFKSCTSLQYIAVDSKNNHFKSSEGILYDISGTSIICYPANKEGKEYKVNTGTQFIAKNCFSNSKLENIELPQTLSLIGYSAFSGCINLSTLTVNNNVTLTTNMFEYCELETINGYKNSNAEQYAEQYLIQFNPIGTLETTLETTITTMVTTTEVTTITTTSITTQNTGATLTYYAPEFEDNSNEYTEKLVMIIIGVAVVSLIVAIASKSRKHDDDDDDDDLDDNFDNDDNNN